MEPEISRRQSLEVALGSTSVQKTLDATKHGVDRKQFTNFPLKVRDLLKGKCNSVKTIAICYNTCRELEEAKWYSVCNVTVRDVLSSCSVTLDQYYKVTFERRKLDLFLILFKDVLSFISFNRKEKVTILDSSCDDYNPYIVLSKLPSDIMYVQVREPLLDCDRGDWKVYEDASNSNLVYTRFRGNLFSSLVEFCDEVICSDCNVNVEFLGKLETASLIRRYIVDKDLDIYVPVMMCSVDGFEVYDYRNIISQGVIKGLTIKDQAESIQSVGVHHASDSLVSIESRLMTGCSVKDSNLGTEY